MGELSILKVNQLDATYKNSLKFNSLEAQRQYFINERVEGLSFLHFKFVDRDTINVNGNYFSFIKYSYLSYTNELGSQAKTFYAIINKIEYVSENTTRLYIEIDPLQTYQFDYNLGECYVDREHQDRFTKDRQPLFNLVPESLDLGKYYHLVDQEELEDESTSNTIYLIFWYVITTKAQIEKDPNTSQAPSRTNDISNSVYTYFYPIIKKKNKDNFNYGEYVALESYGNTLTELNFLPGDLLANPNVLNVSISYYAPFKYTFEPYMVNSNKWGYILKMVDGINNKASVVYYPNDKLNYRFFMYLIDNIPLNTDKLILNRLKLINTPTSYIDLTSKKYETKLLTSPYHYYKIVGLGNEIELNLEYFKDYVLKVAYSRSIGLIPTDLLILKDYNTSDEYDSFYTTYIAIPDLNLRTDKWFDYKLNHKATLQSGLLVKTAELAGSIGVTALSGGILAPLVAKSALGLGASIANDLIGRQDIKSSPDDVRGATTDLTNLLFSNNLIYRLKEYQINESISERIFRYFLHFGYKASAFKTPNLSSRYYYNYIRLIDVNIIGNIPGSAREKIGEIYRQGVTFWHYRDPDTFKGIGNYQYENIEVSLL